jgi:hypothetical protein
VHVIEQLRWQPALDQRVGDADDLGLAADEPEVCERPGHQHAQRLEVGLVAAGDDHRVGGRRQRRLRQPLRDRLDDQFVSAGKALAVGELLPVVEDMNAEAGRLGQVADVAPDVAGADDVEVGGGRERIDVDVHLPAADQPVFLGEVVVEVVVEERPAAGGDRLAGFPEGVVLVAPAADGADRASVGKHQHLRARPLRRRSVGPDHGHERGRVAARKRVGGGGQDLFVQMRTSILDFCFSAAMNSSTLACFFWFVRNCLTFSLTSASGTVAASLCSTALMMW